MRGIFGAVADAIERKAAAIEAGPGSPWRLLTDWPESKSGVAVTWLTALRVTAAWACVNVVANGVAQVPLKIYRAREDDQGADPATDHPLFKVLHRRPNKWQTSFQFRRTLMFHVLLAGDFFAFKSRVGGRIHELIPIEPGRVTVTRERDLSLTYGVTGEDGSRRTLGQDDVWHVTGPSWNSWSGLDATRLAREALGLAMATEAAHADLHRNGVQMSGLFSIADKVNADQYKQLQAWIAEQIGGQNRFKPFVLDRGAAFHQIAMSGVDAQHIETRRLQIEEICRAFRTFPQMIGHAGDQAPTFASAEQFFIAHVVHTLGPWYEDLQQSIDVNLIGEEGGLFSKFTPDALLRGDMKSEAEYFAKALGSGGGDGWMTPNQIRRIKDWNPEPGGDVLPKRQAAKIETKAAPVVETKATPRPLYVYRKVLNAAAIVAWAKAQGFETTLDAADMHVTVAYSRKPLDWMKVEEDWNAERDGKVTVAAGGPRMMDRFGDAVVLLFSSWTLSYRHGRIREAGASWDHDEYSPHVTISYAAADIDLATVQPFNGPIELGPEVFEDLKDDWSASISEKRG